MADVQRKPENVGRILVQVQEDLEQLKEEMTRLSHPNQIDLRTLEQALTKTQEGIKISSVSDQLTSLKSQLTMNQPVLSHINKILKRNTEYVVNMINDEVTMLPTVDEGSRRTHRSAKKTSEATGRPILHSSLFHDSPGENDKDEEMRHNEDNNMKSLDHMLLQKNLTMKAILNPENFYNRSALHQSYGLTLPAVKQPKESKIISQNVTKGPTIEPLSTLPRANRIDPALPPPMIMEKDARKGILSLIQRGLIPPAAELTLDPSPVHHKRVTLHHPEIATRKQLQSENSARGEGSHYMASVKLDLSRDDGASDASQHLGTSDRVFSPSTIPPSTANYSAARSHDTRSPQLRSVLIQSPLSQRKCFSAKSLVPLTVFDAPLQPFPPPATPAQKEEDRHQVVAASKGYSYFIRDGKKPTNADPEYSAFEQRYLLQLGSIVSIQHLLLKLLRDYSVPTALIIGDRLAELASHYELELTPSRDELLSTLDNVDEVTRLISTPGRRYKASDGRHVAATKIRATWKRYKDRIAYLLYRRQRWAAGVIAISWIMHIRRSRVRKQLREIRRNQLNNFRVRAKTLTSEWERIMKSRRVIVHVASLGYPDKLRKKMPNIDRMQNTQMARMCDMSDPNVDVIYVSPVEILEEMNQYYCKLMGMRSAVEASDPEELGDLSARFSIIVPEAINKFPTHHMCLATLLKYSPVALSRIKSLISGRDAYYLPGIVHRDDVAVADELGIPVFGCEPEICHLYSSKSGSRRVFDAADVSAPPGEYDVYSAQQLHESLARLICEQPMVKRWLLKVDMGFDGRYIAYFDVDKHLPCYRWMVRESMRYGDKWNSKWAQDPAYMKVLVQLPEALDNFAKPANRDMFPTWESFLDFFLSQGGIIDAYPPSDSITCLTVTMVIDPIGKVSMTSNGDQIHADNPLQCWGVSCPQASVDPSLLHVTCVKIGEACRARGVMGHFTIDFITFIDAKTMQQILWATDLTLSYSDQVAMTQLMLFVTGGTLDAAECQLTIPPPIKKKRGRFMNRDQVEEAPPNLNRYYVISTKLLHTNMAVVHYSVFFQMCRAHGVGFDIKERQGTVFTLIDASKREDFGMLTVGDDLPGSLSSFARNLSIIHQEISAPSMQGKTNFKAVIEDIEKILGTTAYNEELDN